MTAKRSFRPLILTALVLIASLSCYLISLRVASERAALEDVERDIAMVTRDIRELETEIGTRGRLAQLERWNARFLRLSAPRANQFVDTGFHLANLTRPEAEETFEAPVVLASAEKPAAPALEQDDAAPASEAPARELLTLASIERGADRPAPKPAKRKPAPSVDSLSSPDPLAATPKGQPRDPLAPIEAPAD